MNSIKLYFLSFTPIFVLLLLFDVSIAQKINPPKLAPYAKRGRKMKPIPRRKDEGNGPYKRLVIWGAEVIDGTGAPPNGPFNIVIKGNRIFKINKTTPQKKPKGNHVIDARHMYVTPGFINAHVHIGTAKIDYNASYPYKLWLAHGITTVRTMNKNRLSWELKQKELSKENKIVAPRLIVGASPGEGKVWRGHEVNTPKRMIKWVHYAKRQGVEFIGEIGALDPDLMTSLLITAKKLGMETMDHLTQTGVARLTAEDAVKRGLDEVEHFYGIFESMLTKHSIQKWPINYNYSNEYDRFSHVAHLANESAKPESKKWEKLINLFLTNNTILTPTMSIYSAGRNVMMARNADWHENYTLPSLWNYFKPDPHSHGSYFYHWTSVDEALWHRFFNKWMKFIYDYNLAGGRITVGSDASFIYELFGFGFVKEMKMLQEAGLTPLEVLRSATLYGAESIFQPNKHYGKPIKYGVVREGKLADLLIFTRNPLRDFNMLYGTGSMRMNKKTGKVHRFRALKYTIKDGIIYNAGKLLKDVRQMVENAENREGEKVDISPEGTSKLAPVETVSEEEMPIQ